MEYAHPAPSLFRPNDLLDLVTRLVTAPPRVKPAAAALLLGLSLVLGVLTAGLFSGAGPGVGINVPAWLGIFAITLLAASRYLRIPVPRRRLVFLSASVLLGCLVAWRASPVLQTVNVLGAIALLLAAVGMPPDRGRPGFVTFIFALAVACWSLATGIWRLAAHAPWQEHLGPKVPAYAATAARVLVLTLPLVVVFGALFISADAIFEARARAVIAVDIIALRPWMFWVAAGSVVSAGLLWAGIGAALVESPEADLPEPRRLKAIELGLVMGVLSLLFGLFVVVQLRYLFGGHELVESTLDLSYADYARRGFFELVAVASLLLPVLLLLHWARQRSGAAPRVYKAFAIVLVVLLGVITGSALQRLDIYVDTFGLTELRFYSAYFLVCVAALFLAFLGTVLRERVDQFLWAGLALAVTAIVVLNAASPDVLIVRTNLDRAAGGKELDVVHTSKLSFDALPLIVDRLDEIPDPEACALAALLDARGEPRSDVRAWNFGRAKAKPDFEDLAAQMAGCPQPGR